MMTDIKKSCNTIIKITNSYDEIVEFQKLLFEIYCLRLKWYNIDKFPDSIFSDEYDKISDFALIYNKNRLVGGMRLVKNSNNMFPHEDILETKLPNLPSNVNNNKIKQKLKEVSRDNIVEVTRTISISRGRFLVSYDFVKLLYWYGVHNSIKVYFMVIDMGFFLLGHKLRVPITPISIPIFCEGSWTIPSLLFVDDIKRNLQDKNKNLWEYVNDKSNLQGLY